MFRSIEQLKLNDNQCTCDDDDDEVSDEDMIHAAEAMSSINNIPKTRSYEILCVWMVLFVGIGRQVQQRES